MTTVLEQLQADLAYALSLPEIAESASLTPRTGDPITGQISFNLLGDSESEWSGGTVHILTALLPRATFTARPMPHETLTRADGSVWIIDSLIGESPANWIVKAFSEHRPR